MNELAHLVQSAVIQKNYFKSITSTKQEQHVICNSDGTYFFVQKFFYAINLNDLFRILKTCFSCNSYHTAGRTNLNKNKNVNRNFSFCLIS